MSAMKPKHQRLVLVVLALFALIGAGLLAAYALRNQASYLVEEGSLQTAADGVTLTFAVTGNDGARVPVRFSGIAPDLFVEGSGVVAEGRLGPGGTFIADNLLAKHDENYVPRELQEMEQHRAAEMAEETTVGLE
jgi:cytochrome c-type biogenesis protein CcmE